MTSSTACRPIRHRRDSDERDSGFTLIEVTVAMVILTLFLAIFSGALVSMFHSVNRTQQTAYVQSQANQAYTRLEREIRFANGISLPGYPTNASSPPTVEFSDVTSGQQVCTEIRLTTTGSLQQRSWVQPSDATATVTMGNTVVIANDVTADTLTATSSDTPTKVGPFAFLPATGDSSNQRLEIALKTQDLTLASGSQSQNDHLDATFTALNTGTNTSSDTVCSAGRDLTKYPWPAP